MKKIFLIVAAALALGSCNNNEDNPDKYQVPAKISATIEGSIPSRAVDSSWEPNDQIGISSIVGSTEFPYINVPFTTNGDGNFESETRLYFYKPMTLTAYYPFTGVQGVAPGVDGIIDASTRPGNQKREEQPKIDFLWDSQTGFTADNPNVKFNFAHKMSKVSFVFQSSPESKNEITGRVIAGPVNVEDIINYKINGLVLDGTFNTKNGVCAVKPGVAAESLSMDVNNVKDNEDVLPVIIFPQSLNGGSATLDIYTDELGDTNNLQHYKCNLGFSNGEIKSGYHYKYTIKVSKVGLIVEQMTVEPWELEERYMTATIDGEKVFQ